MESRLPKRKLVADSTDRLNKIAANTIKFGEAFPRVPLSTVNPMVNLDNPPVYHSARTRATSPDPRTQKKEIDRHMLRRSRSISDLSQVRSAPLKRGAAGTVDSIPAKLARMNVMKPVTVATRPIISAKSTTTGLASKSTTSGAASKSTTSINTSSSSFKRPVKPATSTAAPIVKSTVMIVTNSFCYSF